MKKFSQKILSLILIFTWLTPASAAPNANRELREVRAEDRIQCLAETGAGGGAGLGQGPLAAGTLGESIARTTGEAMPEILGQTLRTEVPRAIQNQIRGAIPRIVSDGLRRELPLELSRQIRGLTQAEVRDRLSSLLSSSIRNVLPQILDDGLRDELPDLIDQSLTSTLPAVLTRELGNRLSANFQVTFGGQIASLVTEVLPLIIREAESIKNDILSTIQSFQAVFRGILVDPTLLLQIPQLVEQMRQDAARIGNFVSFVTNLKTNQQKLSDDLIAGLTLELTNSLQGENIEQLSESLTLGMSGPLAANLEGIVDELTGTITAPLAGALDRVLALPDTFIGPIEEALGNLTDSVLEPIDQAINSLTNAFTAPIDQALAAVNDTLNTTINTALGAALDPISGAVSGAAGYIATSINVAAQQINDVFTGGNDVILSEGAGVLPPNGMPADFVGPPPYLANGAPLADDIASVAADVSSTVTDAAPGVAEAAINAQPALVGSLGQTMLSGMGSIFTAGIGGLLSGVPYVGGILSNLVTQTLTKALAGTALGGVAGGLFVPVTEVGALLAVNQNTDKTIGEIKQTQDEIKETIDEIRKLQMESCLHLKVIRRIQIAFEEKEFVYDRGAREANARALNNAWNSVVKDLVLRGYRGNETGVEGANAEEDGQKLFPENVDDHLLDIRKEVKGVIVDELNKLKEDEENYPYAAALGAILEKSDETETAGGALRTTLTKTERDEFFNEPEKLDSETFWNRFIKVHQPENTFAGQFLALSAYSSGKQSNAEQNAREELATSEGWLPIRKCEGIDGESAWTDGPDGKRVCAHWKVLTPASTVKDIFVRLMTSFVGQVENSDENMEDFIKNSLPNFLQQLLNLEAQPEVSKDSPLEENKTTCPGPGPCSDGDVRGGQEVEVELDIGPEPAF